MQTIPLVSVIVPVYNVERYLRECVESIVSQRYARLEVILVDDGSTDASGGICDELAQAHDDVVCFHKPNGGLSDARNYGLARSHGEWVSFIDSDDYVSPLFVSTLYEAAMRHDCLVSSVPGGKDFKDGEPCSVAEEARPMDTVVMDAHDFLHKMLYQEIATGAQWHLYRRSVLGVDPFPKGLYYEDLASTYKFVHRAGKVALVDSRELYAYRLRSTSIIRQSYRHVKGHSALVVADQLSHDVRAWYPDLARACSSRCFSVCRMVFAQVPTGSGATGQDRADRRMLWEALVANRDVVLRDADARPRERLAAAIARMGEAPFSAFCTFARRVGKMR